MRSSSRGRKSCPFTTTARSVPNRFDPVVHMAQFIDVKGEPTRERQSLAFVMTKDHAPTGTIQLRPGPLRISLENRSGVAHIARHLDRRRKAASSSRNPASFPDRETSAEQSNLSRYLPHRYAGSRSAAQNHEPHFSFYRPQRLDRALRTRGRSCRLRFSARAFPSPKRRSSRPKAER